MKSREIIEWCDRVTVFCFYGLIYFVPISTALVEICSSFIITSFFVKRGTIFYVKVKKNRRGFAENFSLQSIWDSFKPAPSYLNAAIGIFVFFNFLSVIFSHYPGLSIKGFVFKLFQGVVLFFAFVECMRTKKQIRNFITIYFISAALIVVNGLAQYFQGKGFVHGHLLKGGRIVSSFNHANDLGAYLVIVIPLLLSFVMLWAPRLSLRRRICEVKKSFYPLSVKIGTLILFMAALYCLGLTFSRGAWIGFLFAAIFLGFQRRDVIYLPLVVAGMFIIIFFPTLTAKRDVSFTSDQVALEKQITKSLSEKNSQLPEEERDGMTSVLWKRKFKMFKNFTGRSRTGWWREALSIIREFPAFGTGLNTYSRIAPQYKLHNSGGVYPHNCYLHMAAETGLFGLLSFLWILFALFKHTLRSSRVMTDQYLSAVLVGTLTGLSGFLIHSFFDTNFYSVKLGTLMWVVMGLIVAIQKGAEEQSS